MVVGRTSSALLRRFVGRTSSTLLRRFLSISASKSYKVEGPSGSTGHEGKGAGTKFKALSLVMVPVIIALSVLFVAYGKEHCRPPFVKYEYMRRRTHRFPWGDGDKSLFHNARLNALSTGYEYDLPEEEECGEEECEEEEKEEK